MKTLTIKTAKNIIYLINGKVSCVRCAITGRFVKASTVKNILNNLFSIARNTWAALDKHKTLYDNPVTKRALDLYESVSNLASTLLGNPKLFYSNGITVNGFNLNLVCNNAI